MPGLILPYSRLFIMMLSLLSVVAVYWLLYRSTAGLKIRAVMKNRDIACCMGIASRRVDAFTFAMGAALAGLAGCALSLIGRVDPEVGKTYIVDSFMVVVLGEVGKILGTVLASLGLGVLPLLNAVEFLSDYYLNLCGKYLSLAILALGMDLIWGYTGILSLGQAVFFGLGAYSMGIYLMLGSSGRGAYGEPIPDFMVWNRVLELPLFWKPYQYFPLAALSALLLPALVAAIIGWLTFRRRVSGTYFAILTQAMAYAAWLLFNRNELNLGGTNGLTDFKRLLRFSLSEPGTLRGLYLTTALGLVGGFLLCRWLVGSKLGLVLTATRDQKRRLQFLGYPVAHYKMFIFAVAVMLAGLAGALYVPQVGIITPSQIGVLPSLEIVVWVATGGRGTLVGAIGLNAARSTLTANYPEWWPIILGGLFVAVVSVFPDGLAGLPRQLQR